MKLFAFTQAYAASTADALGRREEGQTFPKPRAQVRFLSGAFRFAAEIPR